MNFHLVWILILYIEWKTLFWWFLRLICSTYPLTRLIYALAEDGLLYSCIAHLNIQTKTPMIALYTSGLVTATFALLFDKFRLAEISCLGALGAYCLVALCVLALRYTEEDMEYGDTSRPILKTIFNIEPSSSRPTMVSSMIVLLCSTIIIVTAFPAQLIFHLGYENLKRGDKFQVALLVGIILFYGLIVLIIVNQPPATEQLGMQILLPGCLKPLQPVICILINAHICSQYSSYSWVVAAVWMSLGLFIYITYGIWKSKAREKEMHLEQ